MPDRPHTPADATAFREAISQWRLAARTEVKRSSSLPSSMFDACDPMLEARLAESVEAMMNCLHQPARELQQADAASLELRTEQVDADELRRLPAKVMAADHGGCDVDDGCDAEHLALLVDALVTGDDDVRRAARAALRRAFGVDGDVTQLTRTLHARVDELLAKDGADDHDALRELCARVAADALAALPDDDGDRP